MYTKKIRLTPEGSYMHYEKEYNLKMNEILGHKLSEKYCKRKINCVAGPFCISYHTSKKYNKKIYIFGEMHYNEGDKRCTDRDDSSRTPYIFAEMIACNRDKKIDFYNEGPHFSPNFKAEREEYYKKIPFEQIYNYDILTSELLFNINEIPENVHYHSIDRRYSYDSDNFLNELNKKYDEYDKKIESIRTGVKTEEEIKNVLKDFSTFCNVELKKTIEHFIDNEFIYEKQNKQLEGISNIDFIITYKTFIHKMLVDFNKEIKKINKIYSNAVVAKYTHILDIYDVFFIDYSLFLVDTYTIGRMFKEYDDGFNENIIIHCGNLHAENYRKFLKLLDFDEIISEVASDVSYEQSVDVSKFNILSFKYIDDDYLKGFGSRKKRSYRKRRSHKKIRSYRKKNRGSRKINRKRKSNKL